MSIFDGVQTALLRPNRQFGPITVQVTIEENHYDELEITDHPVESGAFITDHAFLRPVELKIVMAFSKSLVSALQSAASALIANIGSGRPLNILQDTGLNNTVYIYQQIQNLQQKRIPFSITTGKRQYKNMLIKTLHVETNKHTENSLFVTVHCREIILVNTQTISVPSLDILANPASNGATTITPQKQLTSAPNFDATAVPP